jgi:hypothetical protein
MTGKAITRKFPDFILNNNFGPMAEIPNKRKLIGLHEEIVFYAEK